MVSYYEELNEIIADVKALMLESKKKHYQGFLRDYFSCSNFYDFFGLGNSIDDFCFDEKFENEISKCFSSGSGLYEGFKVKYLSETIYLICKIDIELGFAVSNEKGIDLSSSDFDAYLIPYDYHARYSFYKPLFMVRRKRGLIGYQYVFIDLAEKKLWGRKTTLIEIDKYLVSSFSIESGANNHNIICMIFFFGQKIESFKKLNIVDSINSFYRLNFVPSEKINESDEFVSKDSWSGIINIKQLTPFYYSLMLHAITEVGYLKQCFTRFNGDYNFVAKEWSNTDFSVEYESLR